MARIKHDVFVPNGDSRKDTAVLLVGTASEYGISQQAIRTTTAGFFITEELAEIVYDGPVAEDEDVVEEQVVVEETKTETPAKAEKPTTKTSGNRAAKNDSEEE